MAPGAARGRGGGRDAVTGHLKLGSGQALRAKGRQTVPANDRLILEMPGGGGLGAPSERDPALVAEDVRNGLVSAESARADYGVVVGEDGTLDVAGTERLRGGGGGQ